MKGVERVSHQGDRFSRRGLNIGARLTILWVYNPWMAALNPKRRFFVRFDRQDGFLFFTVRIRDHYLNVDY